MVVLAWRMREHGVSSLPVYEGERLVGILTERNIVTAVADGAAATGIASACMTRDPVTASPEDDSAEVALRAWWSSVSGTSGLSITAGWSV